MKFSFLQNKTNNCLFIFVLTIIVFSNCFTAELLTWDDEKYITDNVTLQSVLINDKEQSPQVIVSASIENEWADFSLK